MEVVNLLEFLNMSRSITTLDYARCNRDLVNFLDLMTEDEQFVRKIDLGIIYINQKTADTYTIVDGVSRIVSLSLLLHAICECYKKTTAQNTKAIKTIRSKYLIKSGTKPKLMLNKEDGDLYTKIINGERLSGHEKSRPLFILLHNFWTQIKEEKLQAAKIFAMLKKIHVTLVETDDVNKRDIYYRVNLPNRALNQIDLINDYIKEKKLENEWQEIKEVYFVEKQDIILFLKDFFVTKFNFKTFNESRLYENFVNYCETMLQYVKKDVLMQQIKKSAMLYYNMLNVKFNNDNIQKAFINIKKHSGEDTYAYILDVYKDYYDGSISESIFVEILNTIDEYLQNRLNSGKNIDFNELISYLNAFITCK